jgi:hypothetical protein
MPDLWNFPAPVKYTVSVQAEPAEAGMITVTPNAAEFSRGDTITVRARANDNFTFTRWSGDTSSTDSVLTIVVTKDISIMAIFDNVALLSEPAASTPGLLLPSVSVLHNGSILRFSVPRAGMVTLGIHSLQGKLIARSVCAYSGTGPRSIDLPASIGNGMYLVTLRTASGNLHRKVILNR